MTSDELLARLRDGDVPRDLPPLLRALCLDARGDWAGAHGIVQDADGVEAAWVHAYLHRKEGDRGNASYWYRQAGRAEGAGPHEDEWLALARLLLERRSA